MMMSLEPELMRRDSIWVLMDSSLVSNVSSFNPFRSNPVALDLMYKLLSVISDVARFLSTMMPASYNCSISKQVCLNDLSPLTSRNSITEFTSASFLSEKSLIIFSQSADFSFRSASSGNNSSSLRSGFSSSSLFRFTNALMVHFANMKYLGIMLNLAMNSSSSFWLSGLKMSISILTLLLFSLLSLFPIRSNTSLSFTSFSSSPSSPSFLIFSLSSSILITSNLNLSSILNRASRSGCTRKTARSFLTYLVYWNS